MSVAIKKGLIGAVCYGRQRFIPADQVRWYAASRTNRPLPTPPFDPVVLRQRLLVWLDENPSYKRDIEDLTRCLALAHAAWARKHSKVYNKDKHDLPEDNTPWYLNQG
jgi:hypothetical protein